MKKFKKIFQITYLIIFLISSIGVSGNIEAETSNQALEIVMIVSGLLNIGKIIYCNIKNPNNTYLWK